MHGTYAGETMTVGLSFKVYLMKDSEKRKVQKITVTKVLAASMLIMMG